MSSFRCCCPSKYGRFTDQANFFAYRWSTGESLWQYNARSQQGGCGSVALKDGQMHVIDHVSGFIETVDPEGYSQITETVPLYTHHGRLGSGVMTTYDGKRYVVRYHEYPSGGGTARDRVLCTFNDDSSMTPVLTLLDNTNILYVSGDRIIAHLGGETGSMYDVLSGESPGYFEWYSAYLNNFSLTVSPGTRKSRVSRHDVSTDGVMSFAHLTTRSPGTRPVAFGCRNQLGGGFQQFPAVDASDEVRAYWRTPLTDITTHVGFNMLPTGAAAYCPGGGIVDASGSGTLVPGPYRWQDVDAPTGTAFGRDSTNGDLVRGNADHSTIWRLSRTGWNHSVAHYDEADMVATATNATTNERRLMRVDPISGEIVWSRKIGLYPPMQVRIDINTSSPGPQSEVFIDADHDIMVCVTYGSPITTNLPAYLTV